jgi:hypothetical protein
MTSGFRKCLLAASLVILLAGIAAACKQQRWHEFRSTEGAFAVSMPGEPIPSTQSSATAAGPISVKTYTLRLDDGRVAYMVAYNDYPKTMIEGSDAKAILERVVMGALGENGKVSSQKAVALGPHQGVDISATVKDGLEYSSRFLLVNERLYQVSVVNQPQALAANDRTRFMNSFKLLRR